MKAKTIVAVVAVVLAGWMAGTARADFELHGVEQKTVDTFHQQGWLYDQSKAWLVSGGSVNSYLRAYDSSAVDMSGGYVGFLETYNSSTVNISGGSMGIYTYDTSSVTVTGGSVQTVFAYDNSDVYMSGGSVDSHFYARGYSTVNISGGHLFNHLFANDNSTVTISGGSTGDRVVAEGSTTMNISGGSLYGLDAWNDSVVDISGGSVGFVRAYGSSTVTFNGKGFVLGTGLSFDGNKVLGTGTLSGKWLDGTPWTVTIGQNDPGATILAIPEPATLSLLALCGLAVFRRRR